MESSLNKTINFSKQIILSFNLPNKQQYETLIPFFKAGFKAGCHHFNIKYNCIINNKKQNLKEFIQFINELINNSIKENKEYENENKNIFSFSLTFNNNILETIPLDVEDLLKQNNENYRPKLIFIKFNELNNWRITKRKIKNEDNNSSSTTINIKSNIQRRNYLIKNYSIKLINSLENYLISGNLNSYGICGINVENIEDIFNELIIKPKYWQITLNQLLNNFEEIKNLASKLNLFLIVDTTVGVGECKINGNIRINLLRNISKKYERTVIQILHRWLIQHEMFIIKNFGTFNYLNISRQIGISDLKINEKDMNNLNDLYIIKSKEKIKR